MNKVKKISIVFLFGLFALSCTEIPVKIPDYIPPESDRIVLLEELTGVRCPNCPSGAAKVESLLEFYGKQLVVVAVHGEFDAEPLAESKYDFRTEEAEALEDYLKPFWGKPSAAINRVTNDDGELGIIGIDTWSTYIDDELNKAHQLNLQIATAYNENTRELEVSIGIIPLEDLSGTYNLSIALTESHIVDAQLNQTTIIPDFEHNHVFRKMLTAVTGDQISADLIKNTIINKKFSYTLPEHEDLWVAENCHVVTFVTRIEGDSKVVLQAAEAAVVE